MKLRSNNQKRKTAILIGAGVLALIAIIVLIMVIFPADDGDNSASVQILGINLASFPNKTQYYIGEEFDPTGIKVQVVSTKQSESYFVGEDKLTFSGFDSSVANNEVVITVAYESYKTTFTVKVLEKPSATPVLTSIRLSDNFKTTYTLSSWINKGIQVRDVNLICTYSDGTEKEVPMLKDYVTGVDKSITGPCETSFTIRYSEGGIQVETTVTVTITN